MQPTNIKQAKELAAYYSKMRGSSDLVIHGIEGKEGNRTTYVAKISFKQLAEHFDIVPSSDAPAGVMLQRNLAVSRGRNIARYIKDNEDFIFPELIAIVETLNVEALAITSICKLVLPALSFRYFVDGQGRLFGVKDILKHAPELADNTVDVKFVLSRGVDADAQIFTDVNKTPTSPNASQCIAMDSRQIMSTFAKDAVMANELLRQRIDFTKASVTASSDSPFLWTLNQYSKFLQMLTGTTVKSAEKLFEDPEQREHWIAFTNKFFSKLQANDFIANAIRLGRGEWTTESIVPTSVFLKSLALYGKVILMNFAAKGDEQPDWSFMDKLTAVNFSTANPEWSGRCLNYRGRFEDKTFNHKAMASYLCMVSGLVLPDELETVEEEVLRARADILKQQREANKSQAELALEEV